MTLSVKKWIREGGREGSEGQINKEEEREGGSGTGKRPLARERSTWISVKDPRVTSYATDKEVSNT